MPAIESCTADWPFCAAVSDCRATLADWPVLPDISVISRTISSIAAVVLRISRDWYSAAPSSWPEVARAASVAPVTRVDASLIRATSSRSSSMV